MFPPRFPCSIRSADHPMGLPHNLLSPAEQQELKCANYLYIRCIGVAELCLARQIPFAIEFPMKLGHSHATLQDLPVAKSLLSKKGVKIIDFDQCMYGAPTTKPTSLICFGADWSSLIRKCNHAWRGTGIFSADGVEKLAPPHDSALTRNYRDKPGGEWKSKALAAYLTALNEALAACLADSSKLPLGPRAPE